MSSIAFRDVETSETLNKSNFPQNPDFVLLYLNFL